jgi:hypothetical protein
MDGYVIGAIAVVCTWVIGRVVLGQRWKASLDQVERWLFVAMFIAAIMAAAYMKWNGLA